MDNGQYGWRSSQITDMNYPCELQTEDISIRPVITMDASYGLQPIYVRMSDICGMQLLVLTLWDDVSMQLKFSF